MEDPCKRATQWLQSLQNTATPTPETSSVRDRCDRPFFYANLVLRGIQYHQITHGRLLCTFTVPSCLSDESGHWRASALMTLVDMICVAVIMTCGLPLKASVDYNVSYISPVKVHDEIEIDARVLGHNGGLSTVDVKLRNKGTGDLVAQARQSMHNTREVNHKTPLSKI
uniref:Acyl-coenzyme A thioesterase 13 n=1 Tax=Picea sitchensis TaxID=3332 RepID=B8LQB7_PICSI|nr:unknown [Picea sitchensis]